MDEASYAYLFEKDKAMMLCTRDLKYCTWDETGKPIPYCVRFPDDKKCVPNTIPPNILFMGCYSNSSCAVCQRSNDLCKWLTDKVAVPRCSETETIAQCRGQASATNNKKKKKNTHHNQKKTKKASLLRSCCCLSS